MRRMITLVVCIAMAAALAACRNSSTADDGTLTAQEAGRATTESSAPIQAAPSAGAQTSRGDWPRFHGPNSNSLSPETGINKNWQSKPPRMLWKVAMTDQGFAGPSVAGGRVYIMDHQGANDIVRCLDFATGTEKWHYAYPDTDQPNNGFARATPTVDGDRVYTISRLGMLHCFNTSGEVIWKRDIIAEFRGKRPQWDMAQSPVVDGNKLIVVPGGDNAAVAALDKNTGRTLWQGGGSETGGYSTPVIATIGGVRQYVIFMAKSVIGVAAEDGKLLWSYPWQTSYDVNAATPLVIGSNVFITSGYGHGCAMIQVQGGSARALWENKEIQAHFSSPLFWNGHIYGTGDPGVLVCLNAENGQALWRQTGFEKGGIIAADGTIIGMNGANGDLIMARLSPSGYQELGRVTPLGGQSWTAPILASGKLLVRNTSALACLDLK
jgi:outer membrane protein assembly factor BamB